MKGAVMPKFTKKDDKLGSINIDTDHPREIAELKSQGFREVESAKSDPKSSQQAKPADTKTTK